MSIHLIEQSLPPWWTDLKEGIQYCARCITNKSEQDWMPIPSEQVEHLFFFPTPTDQEIKSKKPLNTNWSHKFTNIYIPTLGITEYTVDS
ncbi:MAG TPA: hypothetical protein ENI23_07015 [bacterium]|nr:hypothetical protein [bacterium]